MARYPTVEEAKKHLRIENNEEDDLIALYLESAKGVMESLLNRKVCDETEQEANPEGVPLTEKMKLAMLLLAGDWYRNRENSSERNLSDISYGTRRILISMRKFNA